MPLVLSIAGGEELPVRGDLLWTSSLTSIPSTQSNSSASLSSASPSEASVGASQEEEDSDAPALSSSRSSSSEDLLSSSSEELDYYPPSPPVLRTKSLVLPKDPLLVPSPSSVEDLSAAGTEGYFVRPNTNASKAQEGTTFLNKVFPRSKIIDRALPVASGLPVWQLALFDQGSAGQRVLYARGCDYEHMNLRENLVGLLDKADTELDCDQVVVVLNKKDPNLASLLHSLLYVGGVVIPASSASIHKRHSSKSILVGIEL